MVTQIGHLCDTFLVNTFAKNVPGTCLKTIVKMATKKKQRNTSLIFAGDTLTFCIWHNEIQTF